MRTRRFRPSFACRPAVDILMPRIAPSDIAMMLYLSGDAPAPAPAPGDIPPSATDTGTIPLCPVWTGPTEDPTAVGTTPSVTYGSALFVAID